MCGIVGYVGPEDATPIVFEGLRRLEYRGYDSAGIAVIENGGISVRRSVGKLANLEAVLNENPLHGSTGIGHTRWATHGAPTTRNAHPHLSQSGDIVVVHNGIVENFLDLKAELQADGIAFQSETDTETIAHMIEKYASEGMAFADAAVKTFRRLKGAQAIVTFTKDEPGKLIVCRIGNAGGVAVGLGEGEMYVASDIPAILEHTRRMIFLESRQYAVITPSSAEIFELEDCSAVKPEIHTIPWDPVSAAKGEYKHFMQKEIFEQPRALTDTIRGRVDFETGRVHIPEMNLSQEVVDKVNRIVIVACGTSYYSGLVGKQLIEKIAKIPVDVAIGSEFRYADPIIDDRTAVLALSQSGETVDTLAAMEEARDKGAILWSIVNAIGSQVMRIADGYILMQAGPEIGVASTKAFTTSIIDQYILALALASYRSSADEADLRRWASDLALLPDLAGKVLDLDEDYNKLAGLFQKYEHFLYLGRGMNYPIALEGALKLKEISYIHAEGYPAGEMKHGPIALIDENMPVLAIATKDHVYEKMLSQVEQAKARDGIVIALADEGDDLITEKADHVIPVPSAPDFLAPVVNVIPLQLLAYHIAVRRGADVDQPRNLAKSVTVE